MKNKIVSSGIIAFLLIFHCACGAVKVRERKEEHVKVVKKAALVAFSVYQPASTQLTLNLGKGGGKIQTEAGGDMLSQNSNHIDQIYNDLVNAFQTKLHWQMLDKSKLIASTGYSKSYKDTMEGWQNKMPPPKGQNLFVVKNIMDADGTRILGMKGRNELMNSLGVDALIMARIDVLIKSFTVMGIGNRYPQSRLSFQVFTRDQEMPIWFDGNIEGDRATKSVGKTGFIDENLLGELARESALSAFQKIQ